MAGLVALVLLMVWLAVRSVVSPSKRVTRGPTVAQEARQSARGSQVAMTRRSAQHGAILRTGNGNGKPPPDPLIGMLTSLGFKKGEAVAWAAHVQGVTSEARIGEVLRRHGDLLLASRKVKAGMPTTSTLAALARNGCDRTAHEVAAEHSVDEGAIERGLGEIRALVEAAEDIGTGTLICDEVTGEVRDRIGSGLPSWLQDRGGPKAMLTALDRRSGKLYDDLMMVAMERAS